MLENPEIENRADAALMRVAPADWEKPKRECSDRELEWQTDAECRQDLGPRGPGANGGQTIETEKRPQCRRKRLPASDRWKDQTRKKKMATSACVRKDGKRGEKVPVIRGYRLFMSFGEEDDVGGRGTRRAKLRVTRVTSS